MELKTGHFNIYPVFDFAAKHIVMPSNKDKAVQLGYSKLINSIVNDVPTLPGWYLWGKFNDMGWWETVYLGKAGKQKTSSLHTRLYDELREECIAFWAEVYGREPMISQHNKYWADKYGPPTRALRKNGSRFVVWVGVANDISEADIKKQEYLLIKLYRPTHNAARWNQTEKHDEFTEKIESAIESEVKKIIASNN